MKFRRVSEPLKAKSRKLKLKDMRFSPSSMLCIRNLKCSSLYFKTLEIQGFTDIELRMKNLQFRNVKPSDSPRT